MVANDERTAAPGDRRDGGGTGHESLGPEFPSLGSALIGSVLFVTGFTLILTVIGIPAGILLFAAGLGLMLTPKSHYTR
jgi:hypothetical protein